MKHLICIAIVALACGCKTTSEGDSSPTTTEPETATQPAADPPAPNPDPEPTSQPTEAPEEESDHPVSKCCSGMSFDEVSAFPYSFTVTKKGAEVGTITLDAKHAATFKAADGANAEYVAELQGIVDGANKDGTVSYTYSNRTKETHCRCGGEASKGSAQYPGAFKHAIYSDYFEVSD